MTPLIDVKKAAEYLGISISSVYELVEAGRLPHLRPSLGGRRILFEESDVADYRQSCRRIAPLVPVDSRDVSRFAGPQLPSKHDPRRRNGRAAF